MNITPLLKSRLFHHTLSDFISKRGDELISKIDHTLKPHAKILDIGCGIGTISYKLIKKGYNVTPLDVANISLHHEVQPILFDGLRLPFKENSFDIALLITVLHHTKHPENLIKEAARVAKRAIIIEDTIENRFQKHATHVMDSITNLEFMGHPHTNKSDREWRKIFNKYGLSIEHTHHKSYWKLFRSTTYILKRS